jgi:hypothetical protein
MKKLRRTTTCFNRKVSLPALADTTGMTEDTDGHPLRQRLNIGAVGVDPGQASPRREPSA